MLRYEKACTGYKIAPIWALFVKSVKITENWLAFVKSV